MTSVPPNSRWPGQEEVNARWVQNLFKTATPSPPSLRALSAPSHTMSHMSLTMTWWVTQCADVALLTLCFLSCHHGLSTTVLIFLLHWCFRCLTTTEASWWRVPTTAQAFCNPAKTAILIHASDITLESFWDNVHERFINQNVLYHTSDLSLVKWAIGMTSTQNLTT